VIHETSNLEIVATKIKDKNLKAFIICCLYRPPNYTVSTIKNDISCIDQLICELISTNRQFVICGDFNLKHDWCYNLLQTLLKKYKLSQLINLPTRKDAILDLILTNDPALCTQTEVSDPHVSDHMLISTNIIFQRKTKIKKTFSYRNFKNIDYENLHSDIYATNFDVSSESHVQHIYNTVESTILSLFNKYAPLLQKTITVKERPLKLSDNTKNLIQMRT